MRWVTGAGVLWLCGMLIGCAEIDRMQKEGSNVAEMWLNKDIETLQSAMQQGVLSASGLTQAYLDRIAAYDQQGPALNAIQTVNSQALQQAQLLDEERQSQGPRSALHGIPILVKDNYETEGMITSAGSVLFAQHAPPRDATLVTRLKQAGAIILGKTTMHEFAYGITTQGSRFGATKNPYALDRNPGGSSGGTGAAVAARFAVAGMGSDTCGSIRIPAAQNGLVGLRGTQGLSSRHGIVPLSDTQDIGGPLARNIPDLALILDATVGYDPKDVQTRAARDNPTGGYRAALAPKAQAKIGLLTDWFVQEPADEAVAAVVLAALDDLPGWHTLSLPSPLVNAALQRPLNGHYVLIADFKMNIERYLADNPGIGLPDLEAILGSGATDPSILLSLQASAAMTGVKDTVYSQEIEQRKVVQQALLTLMQTHQLDALAYPTIRQVAAKIGEEQPGTNCRLSANSGLPAITVPVGVVEGVPVGLELLGKPFGESQLLNMGLYVQQQIPFERQPKSTP